ncbi:MAG TPA: Clp protease N-terminal domain-containing protein, partial [Chlamydiales bacterium]|nr:Clp protease N-terminal domain-containing protein [Chlamydiales bacterium]
MSAQTIAQEKGQQQIDALHLLYSLLSQEGSLVLTLLQKLGVDVDALKKKTDSHITKIPTMLTPTSFGQFYLTQDMAKVLEKARQESVAMGDEFISVEHLFLALLDTKSLAKEVLEKTTFFNHASEAGTVKASKLDYETVLKMLSQIRGGQRITDPEPES